MLPPSNLCWDSPSSDSSGSMPLGNGDIGLNVWVEDSGDLLCYVSKTDAWDEHGRLLKLGRLRLVFRPSPLAGAGPFRQELSLAEGAITIAAGDGGALTLRLWVDAHRPVVRIEMESAAPRRIEATFDSWRTMPRSLSSEEDNCPVGKRSANAATISTPDTLIDSTAPRIYWCHRNETSVWAETLSHQGLCDLIPKLTDPLLGRTFGAALAGEGMVKVGPTTLQTAAPVTSCLISLYPLTAQTASLDVWQSQVDASIAICDALPLGAARQAHTAWWREFWARSGVVVTGDEAAETVTRGYALQRYLLACAGRGPSPIKFNGSIFTVDAREPREKFDADYRRWGGGYWFQNTRLMYWAMLMAGDFDLMQALFRMYRQALPLAEARTQRYFGHGGAFFPETMTFWGTYINVNYGYDRTGKHISEVENTFIRRYWQGTLELTALMLEYYAVTKDAEFVRATLLPLARAFVNFFRRHYLRRDDDGRVLFSPAQALETWHTAVNPVPEIVGLQVVLDGLLALPEELTSSDDRQGWQEFRASLPPVPTRSYHGTGTREIIPALQYDECRNMENVGLYAVFPYRRYAVGNAEVDTGRTTYANRPNKGTGGWLQDAIHAAMLGLAEEARRDVVQNFSTWHTGSRFPAFWGPNFDWVPDQDHGSVAMIALQRMLLQWHGSRLYLLPAWPRDWDVAFKLHAPGKTMVECICRAGRIVCLEVMPESRRPDVVLPEWCDEDRLG